MAAKRYRTSVPFDIGAGVIAPVGSVIELEDDVAANHAGLVELVRDSAVAVTATPAPALDHTQAV